MSEKNVGDKMNQRSSVDFVDLLLEDVVNRDISPEIRDHLFSLPKTCYDRTHERMRDAVLHTPGTDVVTVAVRVAAVEETIRASREQELQIEDARALFYASASRDVVQEITKLDRRRLTELRDSMKIAHKKAPRLLRPTVMEQHDILTAWSGEDSASRIGPRLLLVAGEMRLHVSMVWYVVRQRIDL